MSLAPDAASSRPAARDTQVGGDHYRKLAIQPADYCLANNISWAEGCVIGYVTRWRDKGGIQDLLKARHTLDLLIEFEAGSYDPSADMGKSLEDCYAAVRARVAAGGPGWEPK